MLDRLNKALEGWPAGETIGDPPAPTQEVKPGVYQIEKDIPQGKFLIGMRGIKRDDPDAVAVQIMNDILGGSGFTSRIMNRVRTEEGLAYSAGSFFRNKVYYPGEFAAYFQSKNSTCALAAKICIDEITKIRTTPVTEDELQVAKDAAISTFPRTFESKAATVNTFITDEWTHRPGDYWQTYRDKVKALTTADIQQAAQKHLDPAKLTIFIVGKWDDISKGDLNGRATMKDIAGGEVTHLPLRDPFTDQPLPVEPKPGAETPKTQPTH